MNYIKKLNHLKPSFLTSIIILCTILFLILYSINRYLKSKFEIKEHYLTAYDQQHYLHEKYCSDLGRGLIFEKEDQKC